MNTRTPYKKKVLVGLSGGVDSAVAALLLKRQGYEVVGAFMKNFSEVKNKLTGECNWVEEYREAQKVAAHLRISLIKMDFEKEYKKQVIEPMLKAYKKGITPNPDITCNTIIKFPLLWKEAEKLGADYIATGHYARIKRAQKGFELLQGADKNKDQSYFLAELTQKDLIHILFPVGKLTKKEVRAIAEKNKLSNYNRPSTKGICFVGNIPLKSFLENRIKSKEGRVWDENNKLIGRHRGAHLYTIGERIGESKGIFVSKGQNSQRRMFVAKKNIRKNVIIAVKKDHPMLKKRTLYLKKVHWINKDDKKSNFEAKVRIRHLGKLTQATLKLKKNRGYLFAKYPIIGAAPGQTAVFYIRYKLVCSGEISL